MFPAAVIQRMGIKHVKGVLLWGPPGTGKTLIARKIGEMLNAKEPKIVNGPEILNKYVGESEAKIRELFADADADMAELGDDSELRERVAVVLVPLGRHSKWILYLCSKRACFHHRHHHF